MKKVVILGLSLLFAGAETYTDIRRQLGIGRELYDISTTGNDC